MKKLLVAPLVLTFALAGCLGDASPTAEDTADPARPASNAMPVVEAVTVLRKTQVRVRTGLHREFGSTLWEATAPESLTQREDGTCVFSTATFHGLTDLGAMKDGPERLSKALTPPLKNFGIPDVPPPNAGPGGLREIRLYNSDGAMFYMRLQRQTTWVLDAVVTADDCSAAGLKKISADLRRTAAAKRSEEAKKSASPTSGQR